MGGPEHMSNRSRIVHAKRRVGILQSEMGGGTISDYELPLGA